MATEKPASQDLGSPDIKHVPEDRAHRDAVRRLAGELGATLDRTRPLAPQQLEQRASDILARLALPQRFLGFAMVAVSNVFWQAQYEAIPFHRRLFLLPTCLRNRSACKGSFDQLGLHCAGCGRCMIDHLKREADTLGYQVLVAEGTPSVVMKIMEGDADAIIGVACLDSLEKAFRHVVDLGIPHVAVPLLRNGCSDTTTEADQILPLLRARREHAAEQTHTYVPLLRETVRTFDRAALAEALAPYVESSQPDVMAETEAIAREWLEVGGKRLRPFVTLAAYAVARHGAAVLAPDADVRGLIPLPVKKLGVAIEALHKASLAHDDIEDDDAFRYGEETLHRKHGVGPALNVGDYLVGLGYRIIAGEAGTLGGECVAEILAHLSGAHLELCRGQGAELLWPSRGQTLRPIDALSIYALKTAPAFETALYAGLRAAGARVEMPALKRFCTFLGEGYQVLNDLDDWRGNDRNKVTLGQDALAGRPTILRAFAVEAGGGDRLAHLIAAARDSGGSRLVPEIKALYRELGVFEKAETLLEKLRARADAVAGELREPDLVNLLRFLVKIVL